jgi:uncharacterized protein (UPF0335 family)
VTLARNSTAGQQLAALMERVIAVDAEIDALKTDLKEIFAEAKAFGLSPKVMRRCLKLRKIQLDDDKRGPTAEFEDLVATYMHALGWEGTPLWEHAIREAETRDLDAEAKQTLAAMRTKETVN